MGAVGTRTVEGAGEGETWRAGRIEAEKSGLFSSAQRIIQQSAVLAAMSLRCRPRKAYSGGGERKEERKEKGEGRHAYRSRLGKGTEREEREIVMRLAVCMEFRYLKRCVL